jgi:hypothetical protein
MLVQLYKDILKERERMKRLGLPFDEDDDDPRLIKVMEEAV